MIFVACFGALKKDPNQVCQGDITILSNVRFVTPISLQHGVQNMSKVVVDQENTNAIENYVIVDQNLMATGKRRVQV